MSTSGQQSEGVQVPVDRRVSRTRKCIDKAFLALLLRRGYDAMSVSDIVREADVGRATFYEHYASKDDLLRAQLRRLSASMLRTCADERMLFDATPLFAHIHDVPVLYRLIAGRSASARPLRALQEVLEERVAALMLERMSFGASLHAPLTPQIAARVIVANLCALVAWWAEQGMAATAEEMQHLFRVCVSPSLLPKISE